MKRTTNLNFRRNIIIDNDLLSLLDKVNISERDKKIVTKYANGASIQSLAEENSIATSSIGQVLDTFLLRCSKCQDSNVTEQDPHALPRK